MLPKVRHLLRSTEEARELKVINADNLGAFYRYVNHRLTNESGISPLYDTHGELVSTKQSTHNVGYAIILLLGVLLARGIDSRPMLISPLSLGSRLFLIVLICLFVICHLICS